MVENLEFGGRIFLIFNPIICVTKPLVQPLYVPITMIIEVQIQKSRLRKLCRIKAYMDEAVVDNPAHPLGNPKSYEILVDL